MLRGEVWTAKLSGDTVGAEINKDTRPVVIVSADGLGSLPVKVVVPITEWDDAFQAKPWHVQLLTGTGRGLTKTSSADTLAVRSISTTRLTQRLGKMDAEDMEKIGAALKLVLRIR